MPRLSTVVVRATVRDMLSLCVQVFSELGKTEVTALAESCDGHAGMTDYIAEVVLRVVESIDQRDGGLSEFWNAVAVHTGGVPLYEVGGVIAAAITSGESRQVAEIAADALTGCERLAQPRDVPLAPAPSGAFLVAFTRGLSPNRSCAASSPPLLRRLGRGLPDMALYLVTVRETCIHKVLVEAPSEEVARAVLDTDALADHCSSNDGFLSVEAREIDDVSEETAPAEGGADIVMTANGEEAD